MINIILISIFIYTILFFISTLISFKKEYPFKKKDLWYLEQMNSFNYKTYYNIYEIDINHPNINSFDKMEFDQLLKKKYKLFRILVIIQVFIIFYIIMF